MFKHLIEVYALWIKTILIAVAVATWFILTMVLLKALPIEVFPAWMMLSVASFAIYLTYKG